MPDELAFIGEAALKLLADDPDLAAAFLSESGMAPGHLRAAAAGDGFAGALLEFFAASDARLTRLSQASGVPLARISYLYAAANHYN